MATIAGLAPYDSNLDWFAGMAPSGVASLRAAAAGRAAKERHEATAADAEHGGVDLMVPGSHGVWLAERCPTAELWLHPEDGPRPGRAGVAGSDPRVVGVA